MVVDASVLTAALIDDGPDGRWAEDRLVDARLIGPHVLPAEVVSALRRLVARHLLPEVEAVLALDQLQRLRIELWPFEPFAERVWELRDNVTVHDAWYVALAELVQMPLVTLDRRLAVAPGIRCEFMLP